MRSIKLGRIKNVLLAIALGALLVGCSTPQHSNTLIFGTTTKIAIDASQEPTGALGITIGYKRNEAVWMPLIANQAGTDGRPEPATCTGDDCKKFEGRVGADGSAAGPGARDTYSVLATFSGDVAATSKDPGAKGGLAQYFATGIAARLLAQYGGAAVVNTGASSTPASAIDANTKLLLDQKRTQVDTISIKLSKNDGTVDQTKLAALLQKPPANSIPDDVKADLGSKKLQTDLRSYLQDGPESIQDAIYKTLDKL